MGLFDRFRRRGDRLRHDQPSKRAVADLEEFLASREGVEAFLEPPTSVWAMTLCLVAGDGESVRRPVKHQKQARSLCREHNIPLYDARIVGYPQRMKDYERGVRQRQIDLDELPPLEVTGDEAGEDPSVDPERDDDPDRDD